MKKKDLSIEDLFKNFIIKTSLTFVALLGLRRLPILFNAAKFEKKPPIMHPFISLLFANNAVSMAADIIRESSFMQSQRHIKIS